jgi:hypothetical protein
MSSTQGNDHYGPLKLNLTEEERESAREVIATLLGEAGELGGGVLARLSEAMAATAHRLKSVDPYLSDVTGSES